jgi:hypothetical protein
LKPRRKRTKSGPCGGELPKSRVFDDVEAEVPGLGGVLVEDVAPHHAGLSELSTSMLASIGMQERSVIALRE